MAQVNGVVWSMVVVGDRTFIGGDFTTVGGVPRLNAAAILADGTVDPSWDPSPDGSVRALAATADGSRIFLGGLFLNVGGTARSRLAAVDSSTGAVVANWVVEVNNEVYALARHGSTIYAGGIFTTVNGDGSTAKRRVVSLNTETGAVNSTFRPVPLGRVRAITVSPDGSKVYLGGNFTTIGGVSRKGAAEVGATNGQVSAFNPAEGGSVLAVELTPDGSRLFFSTTSNRLHAYDPAVSNSPVFTIHTSGDTQAIASSTTEVYIGGHFKDLVTYKVKRVKLASVYVADGQPTSWDPGVGGALGPWAIEVTPNAVLVGGAFLRIGGVRQAGFARFSGTP